MQNNYQIDIRSILNDVNDVIQNGINKVLYDFTVRHLTSELEKCRNEMDQYKQELENIRKYYGVGGVIDPAIKIKVEPGLNDCGEHIFLNINENDREDDEEVVVAEEGVGEEGVGEEEVVEEAVAEVVIDVLIVEDIETENEEEEEEEEEVEEEEEEEEVEEEEEADEEEEVELIEIDIDDVTYYAENEDIGPIYEIDSAGDPGNQVGYIKDGEPFFSA